MEKGKLHGYNRILIYLRVFRLIYCKENNKYKGDCYNILFSELCLGFASQVFGGGSKQASGG